MKYLIDKVADEILANQNQWASSPQEIWVTEAGYEKLCQQALKVMNSAANAEARRSGEYWNTALTHGSVIGLDTLYGLKVRVLLDDEVVVK